jgi:hypothetical protein
MSELWEILHINGRPDEDNQYIFHVGQHGEDKEVELQILLLVTALKAMTPESVHLVKQHGSDLLIPGEVGELVSQMWSLLPVGAVINKDVLVMHSQMFNQTANAHNMVDFPLERCAAVTSCLIPDPVDTNSDPVFLQQLKGLEHMTDGTVAIVRVTPEGNFPPDNAR